MKVEITPMNSSAVIDSETFNWALSIRRKDDQSVDDIASQNLEDIDASYLRKYLPGWEDIEWKEVRKSEIMSREITAECGEYKLHLVIDEKNEDSTGILADQFKEFMSE